MVVPAHPAGQARLCGWCGARFPELATRAEEVRRLRRYCARSCRQRAHEQRGALQRGGLPQDAVVLSGAEIIALQDRLSSCAAQPTTC